VTRVGLKTEVKFGTDGKPTPASMTALKNEVAANKNLPSNTITLVYYKTSDAEAANMENFITNAQNSFAWWIYAVGDGPGSSDCRDFLSEGLAAANIQYPRALNLLPPNLTIDWLQGSQSFTNFVSTHKINFNPQDSPAQ
jgi:hypothetical protein